MSHRCQTQPPLVDALLLGFDQRLLPRFRSLHVSKGCMLNIMICKKHDAWKMHTIAWMNSNKINKLEYNFTSRYSCTTRVHSIVFIFTKKHFNYLLTSWLIIYKKEVNFQWNSRGFHVPRSTIVIKTHRNHLNIYLNHFSIY